jgi:hypothetical protein
MPYNKTMRHLQISSDSEFQVFHQELLKSRTKSICLVLPARNNFLTPDTQKE